MSELHPEAIHGLQLMRDGEYFLAHEALEAAWRDEPDPLRELYQGILQAAVVYYHLVNGNDAGAVKVYRRSLKHLTGWPEVSHGIEVGRLRRDLETLMKEVRQTGSAHLDRNLLKAVVWHEG